MRSRSNGYLRFIDRYLGIPLVFALGLLRRKRPFPVCSLGMTIGLMYTTAIGDTILISAILPELIRHLKPRKILFFAGPANAPLVELIPGVQLVPVSATRPWAALKTIRNFKMDVWIDCSQWPRLNACLSFAARAQYTIGFRTPKQYRHYAYDATVLHKACHEIDNFRRLLTVFGIVSTHPPYLKVAHGSKEEKTAALHLFAGGSRRHLKEWPQENWVDLANKLSACGWRLYFTGSQADRTALLGVQQALADPESANIVAGKLTLAQTASLFTSMSVVISVDTGMMHLAAALDCPVIALHGPTSLKRWGGVGAYVQSVTPRIDYAPCIHLGYEATCKYNRCMRSISVAQVLQAVEQTLNNRPSSQLHAPCLSQPSSAPDHQS